MIDIKRIAKKSSLLKFLYLIINRWYSKLRERIYNKPYTIKRAFIIENSKKFGLNQTFIETGSFMGDTVEALKPHFKNLISIELSEELARKTKE
jgi:hypothetical protein